MSDLLAGLFRVASLGRARQFSALPGPVPRFPLGNALQFLGRQPWEACAQMGRQYGPIFVVWVFHRPFVVLNDPQLVREVLETRPEEFYKADPVPAFAPLTPGGSLFLANGPRWEQLRAHDPLMLVDQAEFLARQVPVIRSLIRQRAVEFTETTASRPAEFTERLQRLTFDAFAVCIWGQPLDDRTYHDFNTMGDIGARRVSFPPLTALPPLMPSFYLARSRWERTFEMLTAAARDDDPAGRHDLLHLTRRCRGQLSLDAYRTALATMFYGGVYSVTSAVVTTLYLLSRNPEFAQRVRSEVRGATYGEQLFDLQALENCELLDAALRESLRLLPPVPVFLRNVGRQRSVTLGGYALPPDTPLIITTWALHRSDAHWPAAEDYQPQRWLEGAREADPLGSDYFFPFGRGPRSCIGQSLGMFAMKLMLATLLSETDVQISGTYRQSFYFGVMMPRGLEARFIRGK